MCKERREENVLRETAAARRREDKEKISKIFSGLSRDILFSPTPFHKNNPKPTSSQATPPPASPKAPKPKKDRQGGL